MLRLTSLPLRHLCRGSKSPNLKFTKLKKYSLLAEIAKFNARQIFPLYGICIAWVESSLVPRHRAPGNEARVGSYALQACM